MRNFESRQRFSIRKMSVGVVSLAVGSFILLGSAPMVLANESQGQSSSNPTGESEAIAPTEISVTDGIDTPSAESHDDLQRASNGDSNGESTPSALSEAGGTREASVADEIDDVTDPFKARNAEMTASAIESEGDLLVPEAPIDAPRTSTATNETADVMDRSEDSTEITEADAGSESPASLPIPAPEDPMIFDDRDDSISYGAGFKDYFNQKDRTWYLGTEKYTDAATDATASIRFTGTGIEFYGAQRSNFGRALVTIDGVPQAGYLNFNGSGGSRTLIGQYTGLANTDHELILTVDGNYRWKKISLDYYRVLNPYYEEIDDRDDRIVYGEQFNTYDEHTYYNASETYAQIDEGETIESDDDITARLVFRGTGIQIYGNKSQKMNQYTVAIDNVDQGIVDTYSTREEKSVLLSEYRDLVPGVHELVLKLVTSPDNDRPAKISLDYFKVIKAINDDDQSPVEVAEGTIVDNNLQYTLDKYDTVRLDQVHNSALSAWKNDHATSEISISSGSTPLSNVQVTVSDFTGEFDTISKDNISAQFIKSVLAHNGFLGYGNPTRPLPVGHREEANEVIYGNSPVTIEANQLQNIWLDIKVPKTVVGGLYQGTVTISSDDLEAPMVFNYTLNVDNATLPDATDFKDGFDIELWQNPYRVAEYYDVTPFSPEHFAILRPHMEKYREIGGHAVTTTIVEEAWSGQTYGEGAIKFPSMVKWIKQTDGTFRFDYSDLDKWVQFNKDLGIGDKIIAYSVAPWNNKVIYFDEADQILKSTPYTIGNSDYMALYGAFLRDFMTHMEEKGWKEDTYIGIDERGFNASAFDLIESILGKDGKPFKTAGAMDHFVEKHDLAMRVNDLNIGSLAIKANPEAFEALREEREALGFRTTMYTATEHKPGNFALSAPGESYWTMMYAASQGGEGFLRWAYDSWVADPLRDVTHNAFEAGDTALIYPDEKDAQTPVSKSSLRLEKMAEGVRDVNKLLIMKKEAPSLAAKVDELLATIKPTYTSGKYYLTTGGKQSLANDMKVIKAKIASLTAEYVQIVQEKAIANMRSEVGTGVTLEKPFLDPDTIEITSTGEEGPVFISKPYLDPEVVQAEIDAAIKTSTGEEGPVFISKPYLDPDKVQAAQDDTLSPSTGDKGDHPEVTLNPVVKDTLVPTGNKVVEAASVPNTTLPDTGENDGTLLFSAAALSVLAGLGLATTSVNKKKEE